MRSSWVHTRGSTSRKWKVNSSRSVILAIMDKNLVSSACTGELLVFYCNMKSDYYRYLAEFATGEAKIKAVEDAHVSQVVGQVTEVPESVTQDRIQQRNVEQIVDVPVVEELQGFSPGQD